ncbi:MAG TPA: biotin transporter BioY [Vicinamibacterales bacterium]|nr:biotin transporter BioY [Vicinamibacterales bacterium]
MTTQSLLVASTTGRSLRLPIRVAAVGLGVIFTALSAQFTLPMPFTDVPFSLVPMAVLMSGAVLGSRLGAVSQALYLLLGVIGLQVFAPDPRLPAGALRLIGPTGGYLLSYPLAAFVAGWFSERGWDRRYVTSCAALAMGLAVIYTGGLSWRLILLGSFDLALMTSVVPFVLPDLFKLAVAAAVLPQVWRVAGRRP